MEQWEKEYIDAIIEAKRSKAQGNAIDRSYEEGYDSSRWVEITLPDGKKHYVPKESVGNRSRKRKKRNRYADYYEACWAEVESQPVALGVQNPQRPHRYYSEKVSFFRILFKTIRRLLALLALAVLLVGLTMDKPDAQATVATVYGLASLGVIIHAIYYIIRCLFEKNLRL